MTTKKAEAITIKPLALKTVKIRIVGDTPLITHAWSEKAKLQKQISKLRQYLTFWRKQNEQAGYAACSGEIYEEKKNEVRG